jgi:hypothetical protein
MATKRGQSLRAGGGGHGVKTPAPKLPPVRSEKAQRAGPSGSKGKASPGGDHGALHRRDHPPQPGVRKPTTTVTIAAPTGKRPTTVHVRVTAPAAPKTAARSSTPRRGK